MADLIQIRRDTAAQWTFVNPTLAEGEPALETDTLREKIGDGVTPWTSLIYRDGSAALMLSGPIPPTSDLGEDGQTYFMIQGDKNKDRLMYLKLAGAWIIVSKYTPVGGL